MRGTIEQTIELLTQLKSDVNSKDILIKQMNDVLTIIQKLIVDPEFMSSSIYQNFKFKYINDINAITSVMNKVSIDPVYMASKNPEVAKLIDLSSKTKKTKKDKVITADINAPIEFDIYNPKRMKIVKSFKNAKILEKMQEKTKDNESGPIKNIDLHSNKKLKVKLPPHGTYYSFSYNDKQYFLNFDCMRVCDQEMNIIGTINGNLIKIDNASVITLPIYTDILPEHNQIHSLYALM